MALTTGDLAQLKAAYENMSVYNKPVDNNMSIYGVDGSATQTDNTIQQDQETGIAELLLPNTNMLSFNQNDGNNNYVNRNIDYDNLIIRNQNTDQKSNFFTDAMDNIKSYAEKNKILSGIMKAGQFIKDPLMAGATSILGMLPERDPRQGALEDFYGENFGTTSTGSVASGIMQGYNPVSGGLFGGETQYGLGPAIEERIENIKNTLTKLSKSGGKYNYNTLMLTDPDAYETANEKTKKQLDKIRQLQAVKAAEQQAQAVSDEDLKNIQKIQAHTGQGLSQYRMDRPASERQFTGHGTSGMGRDPKDKMAQGGRIRYGEGGIVTL